MTTTSDDLGSNAREQLAGFLERIEILEEEKAQVAEKIKSEYAEAAGSGFEKKAIKQILKDRKADLDQTIEMRAKIDAYRKALGSLTNTPLGDWARSWMANEARMRRRDKPETDPQLDEFLKKRKQPSNDGEAA